MPLRQGTSHMYRSGMIGFRLQLNTVTFLEASCLPTHQTYVLSHFWHNRLFCPFSSSVEVDHVTVFLEFSVLLVRSVPVSG